MSAATGLADREWPAALTPARRAGARSALGIADTERAIVLLADDPATADARRFVHLVGILALAGEAAVALVDHRSAHLDRAAAYTGAVGGRWRLVAYEGTPLDAAAAADAALWLPSGEFPAAGVVAEVVRLGVPVVTSPAAPLVELARAADGGPLYRAMDDSDRSLATALRQALRAGVGR